LGGFTEIYKIRCIQFKIEHSELKFQHSSTRYTAHFTYFCATTLSQILWANVINELTVKAHELNKLFVLAIDASFKN